MALREATRRWAIRVAWACLLIATTLLIGLRLGRPAYYTDGLVAVEARGLAASGMVRFAVPEPACELPGPVVGRVAVLADGRLVYGRTGADGTADLVAFDPTRPLAPPEPIYGLDTGHNELAPAVGPDGSLFFASDRPGAGGYDLFVAAATPSGFAAPVPVASCNTARDETDPAVHENGVDFVFARLDRSIDEGRGGTLFRCRLGDPRDPEPVFGATARAGVADRDPVFAAQGNALWFVRKVRGAPVELMRASLCDGRFDEPLRIGEAWPTGELRGPLPSRDGASLGLLRPAAAGAPDLWYRSQAAELVPWWPGQRWLEWLLLGCAFFSALLLVLLHLGRRWSTLDLVSQCLLLSLLLHVLVFLWLWGVEIPGSLVPGDDEHGALRVELVASTVAAASAEGPGEGDIAARVAFATRERALVAASPGTDVERPSQRAIEAAAAERDGRVAPRDVTANAEVADAAAAVPVRAGQDAVAEAPAPVVSEVTAKTTAAAAAAAGERAPVAAEPVRASTPEAVVERPELARTIAAGAAPARLEPVARDIAHADDAPAMADAGDVAAILEQRRAATAEPTAPVALAASAAAPADSPRAAVGPAAARSAHEVEGLPDARTPLASMDRNETAALTGPAAPTVGSEMPLAMAHAARGPALREAPAADGVVPRREAATPAPPVERAASAPVAQAGTASADAARGSKAVAPHAEMCAPGLPSAVLPARGTQVAAASAAVPVAALDGKRPAPAASVRDTAAGPAASPRPAEHQAGREVTLSPAAPAVPAAAPAAPPARRAGLLGVDPTAVVPPSARLDRARATVASAAANAPAAGGSARREPVQREFTLRDGPIAAPVPVPSVPRPSTTGAAIERSAVATGPTMLAGSERASRTVGAAPPEPAPAPPATELHRARGLTGAPSPDRGGALAAVRPAVPGGKPGLAALRDGAANAAANPAPPVAAARSGDTTGAPVAKVPAAPRPARVDAPRRPSVQSPVPLAKVAPPGSLLERTAGASIVASDAAVGGPSAYSNRFGPAKAKAIERYGGTADTERAVANGLRYLAKIQARDGTWGDRERFDAKYGAVYVGKTALCVLAFLGAGHTPTSRTEHSDVVRRAIDHLLSLQDRDTGAFGPSSCYGHGIATYALAECYGITKDERLLRPLEAALTWILDNQGPRKDRRNRGGWGYFSPGLDAEDDYARVSVSAWMIMALESARLSGIELPHDVLPRAREYLDLSFDGQNGWFRYNHKPSRLASAWPTLPASTPAGAFCLMLLGASADDPKVAVAVEYTTERRPDAYRRYDDDEFVLRGQGNVYFWYYGTLSCFLAGGDAWQRWNERLRTVLPPAQAADGSFPPIDTYAREAGDSRTDRSYTTAMCVLSLEIYYRYFTPLLLGR